jgi:hypothetical protein
MNVCMQFEDICWFVRESCALSSACHRLGKS